MLQHSGIYEFTMLFINNGSCVYCSHLKLHIGNYPIYVQNSTRRQNGTSLKDLDEIKRIVEKMLTKRIK